MEKIEIACSDGYPLAAHLYTPDTPAKAAIMVGPATGIKKEFYHSLAVFLQTNGYGVITFDNRGINESRRLPISKEPANLIDWGKLDMTAALEELKTRFPNTTYHLIGHSAGGQLVGLMENALEISSIFNVACSSGNLSNMSMGYWFQAKFFMNVFIPINNLIFGHTKSHWVGMGQPLPKKVATQWSNWCNGSGYVATDFGRAISVGEHLYDDIEAPSIWLWATDDQIANLANVKDMVRVFTNSPVEIEKLDPKELGYGEIGHMKFFSSRKKALWGRVIEWLEKNNQSC